MPILATNELKERIQSLPTDLRKALKSQAKAKIEIARLEAQIERLQSKLDRENSSKEDEDDSLGNDSLEDDLECSGSVHGWHIWRMTRARVRPQ